MQLPGFRSPSQPATWQSRPIKFGLQTAVSYAGSSVPYKEPWGYLRFWIRDNYDKASKQDAIELAKQAERFYKVATVAPSNTSPLLWYYCFLNLTKAFLLKDQRFSPANIEHATHGIADPSDNSSGYVKLSRQKVTAHGIWTAGKKPKVQIFPALCDVLQTPLNVNAGSSVKISIKSLLSHVVSVHRAYATAYDENIKFCRVDCAAIEQRSQTGKSGFLWHRLTLDSLDVRASGEPLKHFERPGLICAVRPIEKGTHLLESLPEAFSNNNFSTKLAVQRHRLRGIVHPLLLPDGYRYYLHPSPGALRQSCSVYAVMFYLGSIVRYKPQRFSSLIGNKYHWLIEEFLQICPKQFVALMVNEITDSELPFFER